MISRDAVVDAARLYLGTPYHHCGRVRGAGIDCAGLVICVMRDLGIYPQSFDVQGYSQLPDGTIIAACERYLVPIAQDQMQAADVLVMTTDREPQHMGILAPYRHGGLEIIHASRAPRAMKVISTRMMFARDLRFVAAYGMPGVA